MGLGIDDREVIKIDIRDKIKELGGSETGGINWAHTVFPSDEKAQEFIDFLNAQDDKYEHRGLWRPWREDQTWKAMVAWR